MWKYVAIAQCRFELNRSRSCRASCRLSSRWGVLSEKPFVAARTQGAEKWRTTSPAEGRGREITSRCYYYVRVVGRVQRVWQALFPLPAGSRTARDNGSRIDSSPSPIYLSPFLRQTLPAPSAQSIFIFCPMSFTRVKLYDRMLFLGETIPRRPGWEWGIFFFPAVFEEASNCLLGESSEMHFSVDIKLFGFDNIVFRLI